MILPTGDSPLTRFELTLGTRIDLDSSRTDGRKRRIAGSGKMDARRAEVTRFESNVAGLKNPPRSSATFS